MKSNDLRFSTKKEINYEGTKATIYVDIHLNDQCKNGHQDFSITGDIYKGAGKADRNFITGGCIHEDILEHFPDFAQFVSLHLCDVYGAPMYAIENGFYHLQNSSAEIAKNYLRITEREYKELTKAKDRFYFTLLLLQMRIPKRWKEEADKAIKKLEVLTGREFINDSTKSQLWEISEEKKQEISEKVKSGYYSEEAIKEREITKKEEGKRKKN